MKLLELPERRSLTDVIHANLERMILSGELKPGAPVNEKALSDSNGLSRGPIREACRRLEQAGLVEIIVNRGVFVRTISRRDAEELCEIRVVLALHAARLALARMSAEDVAGMVGLMQEIEATIAEGNLPCFYELNGRFHTAIIIAGGNARLVDLYEAIAKELNLFRWRALRQASELDEAATAHRAIVAALVERDEAAFLAAIEAHLRAANRRLLDSGVSDD